MGCQWFKNLPSIETCRILSCSGVSFGMEEKEIYKKIIKKKKEN